MTMDTPPESPGIRTDEDMEEMEVVDLDDIVFDFDSDVEDEEDISEEDVVDVSVLSLRHTESVFSAKFSSNGQIVVTGGQNELAIMYDAKTGEQIFTCDGFDESVTDTIFNHDSTYLAAADLDGNVKVWKVATKSLHDEYMTDSELMWMFWHPLANVLFAGCNSGNTYMWRFPMVNVKILPSVSGEATQCGVLLADGKRLAVGYDNMCIAIWDLKTAKILQKYENREVPGKVISIDAYSDNNLVVAGIDSEESYVVIIKASNGLEVGRFPTGSDAPESVKFSCGSVLGILGIAYKNCICFWDVARNSVRATTTLPENISKIVWDTNGNLYAAGLLRGDVHVINSQTGTVIGQFTGHTDSLFDISISNDNKFIITASDDKTVKIFKIPEMEFPCIM